ncbi:MAG: acylphosphatase [Deltaproteobacteria bacterium]|nr:acylphosphatase [Deltaproteobacteria bacterium]
MKPVRAHLYISGLVQGVYFRANTVDVARLHGVRGWVRNNPDGAVEAVLEGQSHAVERVISWCCTGPPKARVNDVRIAWEEYANEFTDFSAILHKPAGG